MSCSRVSEHSAALHLVCFNKSQPLCFDNRTKPCHDFSFTSVSCTALLKMWTKHVQYGFCFNNEWIIIIRVGTSSVLLRVPTELCRYYWLNQSKICKISVPENASESVCYRERETLLHAAHSNTSEWAACITVSVNIKMQKDCLNMNPACSACLYVNEWQRHGFVCYTNTGARVISASAVSLYLHLVI